MGAASCGPQFLAAVSDCDGYTAYTPMNNCPCFESVKTLVTTGKWVGVECKCCKKVTIVHLIIAGVCGFLLAGLLASRVTRRRD